MKRAYVGGQRGAAVGVSHLVQMDTGVNGSFGLVAFKVGVHGLFAHAHGCKHLANILQHRGGKCPSLSRYDYSYVEAMQSGIRFELEVCPSHPSYRQKFVIF